MENLISEGQFWEMIDGSLIGANYSVVSQEDNLRSILAEKYWGKANAIKVWAQLNGETK